MRIKKRKAVMVFLFVGALFLVALPGVAAAASASPGSTSTVMGMPVQQRVTGLTASTLYDVVEMEGGTNTTIIDDLLSDTDGVISFTISPDDYGQNVYVVRVNGGADAVTFNVDNMDVVPYIMPIILLGILFTVFVAIQKGF